MLCASTGRAQDRSPAFRLALAALEAQDTAAAVARLREAIEADPRDGRAYLRLGALLAASASPVERDFQRRAEAYELLAKAARLLPDDPEALLEYGSLLSLRHQRVDAERVLRRALERVQDGATLEPAMLARLHTELAKVYESRWEDGEDLIWMPPTAEPVRCSRATSGTDEDRAVACPRDLVRQYERAERISDQWSGERARMMEHFRLALQADPARVDAAVHLLGHLAHDRAWDEYLDVATSLTRAAPDSARSHLFLGLGLHEAGRSGAASAAFARAQELAEPSLREVFDDLTPLLEEDARPLYEAWSEVRKAQARDAYFTAADPLYLTSANERRLEHYARVAWADLRFGAPAAGLRGWETDRGNIWIRYGRPWLRYQCCGGKAGKRVDYWVYSEQGPVFVFERALTYRTAWHTEFSGMVAADLDALSPTAYQPKSVSAVHDLPLQLVRFRGSLPSLTRVEIYASPPLDSLAALSGADLETGVFVFDQGREELWSDRRIVRVVSGQVHLRYEFEVPRGVFHYGAEARLAAPESMARPAARARDRLEVEGFPPGRLSVSDLLLARNITEKKPSPRSREELEIEPARTLSFRAGEPVSVYFEAYDVEAGVDGTGGYRAELSVEDRNQDGLLRRIVSTWLPSASRREQEETRVTWERRLSTPSDRTADYLELRIPDAEPGDYGIRLRLTDLVSGSVAETLRVFRIEEVP